MLLQSGARTASGAFVGLQNFAAYLQTPALARSLWNSVWVAAAGDAGHGAGRVPLRLRADAQLHAVQGHVPHHRAHAAARALAARRRSRFIYWFGNQGVLKSWLQRLGIGSIYGAPGIILSRVFSVLPARADDPDHRAGARRRAPLRGRRRARHARRGASSSPSPCPARSTACISAALVIFTLHHHRLRHPEGDRRQLQRARHRHLQAGDRPAGLPDGRGGRRCSCSRPSLLTFAVDWLVQPAPDRRLLTARSVPYVAAAARGFDSPMTRVLRAGRRAAARGARHGGLRLVHQALAVRPVVHAASTTLRPGRRATYAPRS